MTRYHQANTAGGGGLRITHAVQRLILLNIACFAGQLLLDPLQLLVTNVFSGPALRPGGVVVYWLGFQPDLFVHGHLWKPFTYQFLHSGLFHLFMNMLSLFVFGPEVERALGTRQFYRFYIFCGAAGVLATILPYLLRGEAVTIMGASGAVLGVLVAFAMVDPERELFLFPIPVPVNARALVLIMIVLNVMTALSGGAVSVATHFGGMGAGFLYMKCLPGVNAWLHARQRPLRDKKPQSGNLDRVGEEVDNIFKFENRDRR
jgi:membrane associated rhomboid family serine protease